MFLTCSQVFGVDQWTGSASEVYSFTNDSPIIGILAQPSNNNHPACGGKCEYIAASYVKYVESAGARVVPISYYANNSHLDYLFNSLNGFLFPGGETEFPISAQHIFDRTIEANDRGDYTPLWGTCLGFEWLFCAAAANASVLDSIVGTLNVTLPLQWTSAALTSRLLSRAGPRVRRALSGRHVAFNQHNFGVYAATLDRTPALSDMFTVLSTSQDATGRRFVSTVEARGYPIYGTQWHPEKNIFECAPSVRPGGQGRREERR